MNEDLHLLNGISTYLQKTGHVQTGFRVDNYFFIEYENKVFKVIVEEIPKKTVQTKGEIQ